MPNTVIGVLTWREGYQFKEEMFFKLLYKESQKLGITLYFFAPADVKLTTKKIKGVYVTSEGKWGTKWFPWPDIVIDRFRFMSGSMFKDYLKLRKESYFQFVNSRLANKWSVHKTLMNNEKIHKWLPETVLYSEVQLKRMLEIYRIVYVKPVNGTGGRGICRVIKNNSGFHLLGRTYGRKIYSKLLTSFHDICTLLRNERNKGKYIIQQGLQLDLVKGRTVDMRILIQKDESGYWGITGMGIRVGNHSSVTSNLHGGGKPLLPEQILKECFPEEKTREILEECEQLGFTTAETIEKHYGRMMELGIDVGIDTKGRCWLIEVNPKPGREVFKQMGQLNTYKEAIQNPLKYALYLINK